MKIPLSLHLLSDQSRPPHSLGRLSSFELSTPGLFLIVLTVLYACTFSYLTLLRYAAFESRALDMGNLNQAIWNTAYGNWFHLTNQPGTINRLSLHVEPILLPIALIYRVHPFPPTLLVIQAFVVALGALPIFALARHKLRNEWVALGFAIIYLVNPTIQAANWLEFHPVTLAPTFLLAAFYYLIIDRAKPFALFAILAASCKEEIALIIFMMGLYAWLIHRRTRWGLITMGLSMSWALLAVLGIQQLFADGNIHWGRYNYLGDSPSQMVISLIARLDLVWAQLMKADAGGYLWSLLWPTGFLALLAPEVTLLALPSLAINLLADFPPMHETNTLIYAAPVIPMVLAGAVMGMARVQGWLDRWNMRVSNVLIPLLTGCVVLLALVNQRLYGYLPGSGNAMALTVTEHHRRAASIMAQIPPDAAVSAQDRLNPHVSGRETVYIFPRVQDERTGDAEAILVDVTGPAWPQHPNDLHTTIDELLAGDYGVAAADDGYLLLRRGAEARTLPESFYTAWRKPEMDTANSLGVQFGDVLELVDFHIVTDRYGEVVAEIKWLPLREIEEDLHFYVAYVATDGAVLHANNYYQPVSVLWYPTSLWETGMGVQIATLPWSLDADAFVPLLGVYRGETWGEGEPLPVVTTQAQFPLLEGGNVVRLEGYTRDDQGIWLPISMSAPVANQLPTTPIRAYFGGMLELVGANLPAQAKAGEPLNFTLHWQASAPVDFDYSAFAHLLDAGGNKVAQADWQPRDAMGILPTSTWPLHWPVIDAQQLQLPADLPAGEYTLLVGFYNWQSGDRLPAEGLPVDRGVVVGDAVQLGPLRIE